MMRRGEDGGSPSELQAKILEGLLSGSHHRRNTQSVNQELPAKNIIAGLLKSFVSDVGDAQLKLSGQNVSKLSAWWSEEHGKGIIVTLGEKAGDESPCLILLQTNLVEELLSVSLGGMPGTANLDRMASKMECKYAQLLAPALAQAIKPLLRSSLQKFDSMIVPCETMPDFVADQSVHVLRFSLELFGISHPILVVLPESKVERRAAKLAAAAPQNRSNAVASEIEKTNVKLEIFVQLPDQTLELLKNLRAGDEIPLAGNSLTDARMAVRGHEIFKGQIGRLGQKFGFQITQSIEAKINGLTHMVKSLTGEGVQQ